MADAKKLTRKQRKMQAAFSTSDLVANQVKRMDEKQERRLTGSYYELREKLRKQAQEIVEKQSQDDQAA